MTGANRHDVSQLELVLDEIVIEHPKDIGQHLCADKGYSGEPAQEAVKERYYIPHVKQRGELSGKGNKFRRCPLWPATAIKLASLVVGRKSYEPVFLNRRKQPITRFGILPIVKRSAQTANETLPKLSSKRVTTHIIRHTTAVHLLRSGVDINTIRAWLGHVSLDTTHVYAETDLERQKPSLNVMFPHQLRITSIIGPIILN